MPLSKNPRFIFAGKKKSPTNVVKKEPEMNQKEKERLAIDLHREHIRNNKDISPTDYLKSYRRVIDSKKKG